MIVALYRPQLLRNTKLILLILAVQSIFGTLSGSAVAAETDLRGKTDIWSVIGPFALPKPALSEEEIFAHDFGVGTTADHTRRIENAEGTMVFWAGMPHYLPAPKLPVQKSDVLPAVYFAVTHVTALQDCQVPVTINAQMPLCIFYDGKSVSQKIDGEDKTIPLTLSLKKGEHELILKCIVRQPESTFTFSYSKEFQNALAFSCIPPQPVYEIDAAKWKLVHVPQTLAESAKTFLTTKDDIGFPETLPEGEMLSWQATTADKSGNIVVPAADSGITFLMTHVFKVPTYQGQVSFFIHGTASTEFYTNGKKLGGRYDPDKQLFSGKAWSYELKNGVGRLLVAVPSSDKPQTLGIRTDLMKENRILAEIPESMDPTFHAGSWPSVEITNGIVTASVALPDNETGYYRGNRFERAGIITNLSANGMTYFLTAPKPHQPFESGKCCGPCEEWFDALGYDEFKPGDPYLKIGVGLYERTTHPPHCWYYPYWPLKMFEWKTETAKDRITFSQEVEPVGGYGYRYVKRLILVPNEPVLLIEHELTNTGTKIIDRTQYAHNFTAVGGKSPSDGTQLTFDFDPNMTKETKKVGTLTGKTFTLETTPDPNALMQFVGWPAAPNGRAAVTIQNPASSAALRIEGDMTPVEMTVFIDPRQLSCEPFYRIVAEPGKTVTWTRKYSFLKK